MRSLFLYAWVVVLACCNVVSAGTIAIFGGSGKLGRECVYQGLQQGNKVIVLSRDTTKLVTPPGSGGADSGKPFNNANLISITGSVTNPVDVESVFAKHRVTSVIVALGGRTKDVGPTMLTDGTTNIIASMKKHGVKRIAVVTSIGCGDSTKQAPWSFKILMYTMMRKIFKDKNNQESLFLSADGPGHDLEYTIVRPGGLGEGPPTGIINVIEGKAGSIQRADVASFVLRAVQEQNFPYLRQTPALSSVKGTGWKKEKGFDKPTEL